MSNGKQGERLFQQIMENRKYKVVDVSQNPEYWDKDIDFILTSSTSGDTKTFEVKWDSKIHNTNNLFLELTNTHSKGGLGWFAFCQADFLAYGDAVNHKFYIIPLLELKEKIKAIPKRYGRCGYESEGLLINLNDIKEIVQEL